MTRWIFALLIPALTACAQGEPAGGFHEQSNNSGDAPAESWGDIKTGAEQTPEYLPLLEGKNVALIANQTTTIGKTHLVDSLLGLDIRITKVFAPEHGFRGTHADGATIKDETDPQTGLPVISIYGKTKKPSPEMLEGVDVMVFDIQDVGVRCYTYISTMHYCMEAAAEQGIPFVVLDRPNPNGFYTDGPVLDMKYQSFVGMHPIPLVHGLTIGELATMIKGEGWISEAEALDLTVIPCANYTHEMMYALPVAPSPNLPNMNSVYLYPSLVLLEATQTSVGRGTEFPFQMVGFPGSTLGDVTFYPKAIPGVSDHPKHKGEACTGFQLDHTDANYARLHRRMDLSWLLKMHEASSDSESFFDRGSFFDKLAGTSSLRRAIKGGMNEKNIRATWQSDLTSYRQLRRRYLLYSDFR